MEEEDPTGDFDDGEADSASQDLTAQLVKRLVRYAIACEYSRLPIRREGIREKGSYRHLPPTPPFISVSHIPFAETYAPASLRTSCAAV